MSGPRTAYLLERAWVAGAVAEEVLVEIEDGRFTRVEPGAPGLRAPGLRAPGAPAATRLAGLTLPGLANGHSHAFHRALRGRTQRGRGTFWSWREQMYAVAGALDPDSYAALARAVYREMAAAGWTGVAEFHYLHHQPDGTPYADPNAMGHALAEAAAEAGIRLTLLDTCYLSAGFGAPVTGVQRRFSDGDADAWAARRAAFDPPAHVRSGAAFHSVRAVPPEALAAHHPDLVHVHLSEQPAENAECRARLGRTPTQVLADAGQLHPGTGVVHATHLEPADVALLGGAGVSAVLCPTTERDLADGLGRAADLASAGARLALGSDSHAVLDPFEEMRALETHERLGSGVRGHFTAAELLAASTRHDLLGVPDAGRIQVGARADLVTLDTRAPRTAGTGADAQSAVWAATAAEVVHVVADGRVVARAGDAEELGHELEAAIERVLARAVAAR